MTMSVEYNKVQQVLFLVLALMGETLAMLETIDVNHFY